jgi:hypothetical protein
MSSYFSEKVYDDFLFDCWQANQRLTEEDWEFFGREEHHMSVPKRDGGILCPLNSQFLTKYQHWVAGVLQSEVEGKACFAFIPRNALPKVVEALRVKWQSHESKRVSAECREERSKKMKETNERMKKEGQPWWTEERRQKLSQKMTERNNALVAKGKHPMQSPEARAKKAEQAREQCLQSLADGTNAFLREGFSRHHQLRLVSEGKHNFQGAEAGRRVSERLKGRKCWVNRDGKIKLQREKPEGEWQNGRKWKDV